MADYDYMGASNGSGDAALMHVTNDRITGSTTLQVDSVTNVPTKFIGTYGPLLPSGLIDPANKRDFKGHVDTGNIIIDAFEPGNTDAGTLTGWVVVIKPSTGWANRVAAFIKNATNFGTPESVWFAAINAASAALSGALTAASAAISGALTVGGNISITGTSRVVAASVVTADGSNNLTPTSQEFEVTALAHDATIVVPSYTPQNMMSGTLKIKDDGNMRGLTWPSGWLAMGVTLPGATVAGKWLYVSYKYSSGDTKYHVLGIARQP